MCLLRRSYLHLELIITFKKKPHFLHFQVLLFAIPTEHLRSVLQTMKPFISQDHLLIFANKGEKKRYFIMKSLSLFFFFFFVYLFFFVLSKGIEISSLSLPYVVVEEVLGKEFAQGACFLSGPSFASEVRNNINRKRREKK